MIEFNEPSSTKAKRPLLSIIFTVLYLALLGLALLLPFVYNNLPIIKDVGFDRMTIMIPAFVAAFYTFIIALSFFLRGDNWLTFSIVLIFFATLAGLALAGLGIAGGRNLFSEGLPSCANDINLCNDKDGISLLSALLLGISIPLLVLNIVTFIAAYKTMGSKE